MRDQGGAPADDTEVEPRELGPATGQDLAAVPRRILLRALGANAIGAVLVYLYLQFLAPGAFNPRGSIIPGVVSLVVLVVYLAGAGLLAARLMAPYMADVAVLSGGAPPGEDQRDRALGVPARVGWMTAAGWGGAALLFGALNAAAFGNPAVIVARITIGVVLGGMVTSALTATLVERGMQPILAVILAGDPGGGRGLAALAIRARLLRAWVLGAAVPLLAVGLTPLARTAHDRSSLVVPIASLAGLGLVVGIVIFSTTASAVSEPLRTLRRAVDAVRDGDLTVSVPVDDAGEIGMLEAGVNDMVAGLRQRQALQDLFGRHVGEAVARRAVEQGPVTLGGTQAAASALFVDLIGSTALALSRPAHEVVSVLNTLFAAVVSTVTAEGGWVNKFEGDGALCVFGVPDVMSDHATRALRAARRLRQALRVAAAATPGLDAAIGVAAGTVVAGNIGAEDRYEYTVIGDPVNEAARLSEKAKAHEGRLLASATVVDLAGPDERRQWRPDGEALLRGRSQPTRVMRPVPHHVPSEAVAPARTALGS